MTNKQKLQAFANHLGCEVLVEGVRGVTRQGLVGVVKYKPDSYFKDGINLIVSDYYPNTMPVGTHQCKLILKPIEEAENEKSELISGLVIKSIIRNRSDISSQVTKEADYLRSKDYHLPYMGYDLYEQGLAITPKEAEKLLKP